MPLGERSEQQSTRKCDENVYIMSACPSKTFCLGASDSHSSFVQSDIRAKATRLFFENSSDKTPSLPNLKSILDTSIIQNGGHFENCTRRCRPFHSPHHGTNYRK